VHVTPCAVSGALAQPAYREAPIESEAQARSCRGGCGGRVHDRRWICRDALLSAPFCGVEAKWTQWYLPSHFRQTFEETHRGDVHETRSGASSFRFARRDHNDDGAGTLCQALSSVLPVPFLWYHVRALGRRAILSRLQWKSPKLNIERKAPRSSGR
jgi:hypothetical protein